MGLEGSRGRGRQHESDGLGGAVAGETAASPPLSQAVAPQQTPSYHQGESLQTYPSPPCHSACRPREGYPEAHGAYEDAPQHRPQHQRRITRGRPERRRRHRRQGFRPVDGPVVGAPKEITWATAMVQTITHGWCRRARDPARRGTPTTGETGTDAFSHHMPSLPHAAG